VNRDRITGLGVSAGLDQNCSIQQPKESQVKLIEIVPVPRFHKLLSGNPEGWREWGGCSKTLEKIGNQYFFFVVFRTLYDRIFKALLPNVLKAQR
jgi:hypothetical protein